MGSGRAASLAKMDGGSLAGPEIATSYIIEVDPSDCVGMREICGTEVR